MYKASEIYIIFLGFIGLDNFSIFDLVRQGKTTRG